MNSSMRKGSNNKTTQRQRLMKDFFSQQGGSQRSTILAYDTQASRMGKGNSSSPSRQSQFVLNSQLADSFYSQGSTTRSNNSILNNSIKCDDSDDEIQIIEEPQLSQLTKKAVVPEEVICDSQGSSSDERYRCADHNELDLDGVSSQMDFRPAYTSTQRDVLDSEEVQPSVSLTDRKRKKTALTGRTIKKPANDTTILMRNRASFLIAQPDNITSAELPTKRLKCEEEAGPTWESADDDALLKQPLKRKIHRDAKNVENAPQDNTIANGYKADISQLSTGKSYEVENHDSFLRHRCNRSGVFSEDDISKIVANMKDLVETMVISRKETQVVPTLKRQNSDNVKKFKKAAQGRFNPRLRCSQQIIGTDEFKDFRAF